MAEGSQYGKKEYWEDRYTKDQESFDWYQQWPALKDIVAPRIPSKESRILNVGCGNSKMPEQMYDEGWQDITNIDISFVAVKTMKDKHAKKEGMKYEQMDVLDMSRFASSSFDVIIDKGTLDCILCGEDSTQNAQTALREITRILKPGGVYMCITYGQPDYRLIYLETNENQWKVETQTVSKPQVPVAGEIVSVDERDSLHYVYICTKEGARETNAEIAGTNFPEPSEQAANGNASISAEATPPAT